MYIKHMGQEFGVQSVAFLLLRFRCCNRAMKMNRTMKPSTCLNKFSILFFFVLFVIQQHSDFFSEYGINRDYQMENTVLFEVFLVFYISKKRRRKFVVLKIEAVFVYGKKKYLHTYIFAHSIRNNTSMEGMRTRARARARVCMCASLILCVLRKS